MLFFVTDRVQMRATAVISDRGPSPTLLMTSYPDLHLEHHVHPRGTVRKIRQSCEPSEPLE